MAPPTKVQLRKEFLTRRNALDAAERTRHSSLIRQRVFQFPAWKNAETILCYVSFGSEVDTHLIIQGMLRFKKRVVVPLHDPATHDTPLSELKRFGELGPNHRGVLQVQPEFVRLVDPTDVDLALVPGIIFDREGGRVGFGGGYFDRLFPKMPKAFRLGLCFTSQFYPTPLPLESYDVRLHALITEKELMSIKRMAE